MKEKEREENVLQGVSGEWVGFDPVDGAGLGGISRERAGEVLEGRGGGGGGGFL